MNEATVSKDIFDPPSIATRQLILCAFIYLRGHGVFAAQQKENYIYTRQYSCNYE